MKKDIIWVPEEEARLLKEWWEKEQKRMLTNLLWGQPSSNKPTTEDFVKLAYVDIDKDHKHVMIGIDNRNMEGYKLSTDTPTVKIPLERQDYVKFERWCTSFDV